MRSLLGEFLVIVAGVLAALAVDQWKDTLDDHRLEAGYMERLRNDLAADTAGFANFDRTMLAAKVSVLRDLLEEDALRRLSDRPNLIEDLTFSLFKALPANRPTTFEVLESTGGLGLIRDVELRDAISAYYSGFIHISRILSEPDGDYTERMSRALPGAALYDWRISGKQPTPEELGAGIAKLLRDPELQGAVNSELEYTAGLAFYLRQSQQEAADLLRRLDES